MKILRFCILLLALVLVSCFVSSQMRTDSIHSVTQLDLERYSGIWYEIVRMPHRFESHLTNVTATYTIQKDGEIKVLNRGYNPEDKEWSDIEGKAWRPDEKVPGELKVSFFWFFSSLYKVIMLDEEDYQWAVVTSSSKEYLWVLSRTPQLNQDILYLILDKLRVWNFDLSQIQYVSQENL